MATGQMIFTAQKESFIVRVLMGKVRDAGIGCIFVPWDVDALNDAREDIQLFACYLEDNIKPTDEVLHFLADFLDEKGGTMVLIGEHEDIAVATGSVPRNLIYKTFPRPVDNAAFAECITGFFEKLENGEFMKKILVVDDDPQYLNLIRQWLSDSYRVAPATSGMQAIKYLGKNKVDLILLDYEMPVTTGPQVLEMLRSDEETKSIPVMFLTGKNDKESVMEVLSLRPEGYFLKTIQREELLQELKKYFESRSAK